MGTLHLYDHPHIRHLTVILLSVLLFLLSRMLSFVLSEGFIFNRSLLKDKGIIRI